MINKTVDKLEPSPPEYYNGSKKIVCLYQHTNKFRHMSRTGWKLGKV